MTAMRRSASSAPTALTNLSVISMDLAYISKKALAFSVMKWT